jgi:ATP-dependent Clp protease ATP-binding subunit ClpA
MNLSCLDETACRRLTQTFQREGLVELRDVKLPAVFEPPRSDLVFLEADGVCEVYIGAQTRYRGPSAKWREITTRPVEAGGARQVTSWRGGFTDGLAELLRLLDEAIASEAAFEPAQPWLRDVLGAYEQRSEVEAFTGRRELLDTIITNLARQSKPGLMLLGSEGVGKTALSVMIAREMAEGRVPESLRGLRLLELSIPRLLSDGQVREVEAVVEALTTHASSGVIFIDDAHELARDELRPLRRALRPRLAMGEVRLVGATTHRAWRELEAHGLQRLFLHVTVPEPTLAESFEMLKRRKGALERHHRLVIEEALIKEAIVLADRCLPGRALPDGAFDLLDHGAAFQTSAVARGLPAIESERRGRLARRSVRDVAARASGVDVGLIGPGDAPAAIDRALGTLRQRLLGQGAVLDKLSRALTTRAALRHLGWARDVETLSPAQDRRPMATILACGPTGVGKSETAKILADELFEGRTIFLNGTDVGPEAKHGTSTWVGSPPGYIGSREGGVLTNGLREASASVILIDEIEKASTEALQNVLLPLLGDGLVTDRNNGESLLATHCLVFCTSNIILEPKSLRSTGFLASRDEKGLGEARFFEALTEHLLPEVVGRFNVILDYAELDHEARRAVWDRLVAELEALLGPGTTICLDEAARALVEERLAALKTGARGVQDLFGDALAPIVVLAGGGHPLLVTRQDDRMIVERGSAA